MWFDLVLLVAGFWGGLTFGKLFTHHWYYEHFRDTLRRRIYEDSKRYESVQERLADQGEKRCEVLDRQAVESDLTLFSKAVLMGFAAYLRKYINEL